MNMIQDNEYGNKQCKWAHAPSVVRMYMATNSASGHMLLLLYEYGAWYFPLLLTKIQNRISKIQNPKSKIANPKSKFNPLIDIIQV